MFFPAHNNLEFKGYSDSDWAGDVVDRRSVGGYCFLLGPVAISWRAKKQSLTSHSSAEAEYRALADASCEVMWLKNLLQEFSIAVPDATPLLCDSKAAIDLTANPVYHARTKHIEIDAHFIREKIAHGIVRVIQITSKENVADVLTKGLGKVSHWSCVSQLGITFAVPAALIEGKEKLHMDKGKNVITEEEKCKEMSVSGGANETIYSLISERELERCKRYRERFRERDRETEEFESGYKDFSRIRAHATRTCACVSDFGILLFLFYL